MSKRQESLFEGVRMTMQESIELTVQSLLAYGADYRHWAIAFSGGKDSTATVTLVIHLIATGQIPAPESLTVLYADTRMELTPLQVSAMQILEAIKAKGLNARVVLPEIDNRYFVYMFGRGVPPPKNRFRWCTPMLKITPMMNALKQLRDEHGDKFLMLTGVRLGESAARDQHIAISCSRDGAECGQGWFQEATPEAVADTLAPLLHWRVCHVWDWLMFDAPGFGYPTELVAEAYGGEEAAEINARTGCVGCNLVETDKALDSILKSPKWAYLRPFKCLRPVYRELIKPQYRLRKDGSERRTDGAMVANPMRLGPLTMEARRWGLGQVLNIQDEINRAAKSGNYPKVSLINKEELARINELIEAGTWPNGWEGDEVTGDVMMDEVIAEGVIQPLLSEEPEEVLNGKF